MSYIPSRREQHSRNSHFLLLTVSRELKSLTGVYFYVCRYIYLCSISLYACPTLWYMFCFIYDNSSFSHFPFSPLEALERVDDEKRYNRFPPTTQTIWIWITEIIHPNKGFFNDSTTTGAYCLICM